MKIELDLTTNSTSESYAVEMKIGNHPNHKTFNFVHKPILFTGLEPAFIFADSLLNLPWDEKCALPLEKIDIPFFVKILLSEYNMEYLYKTDFQVRKLNVSYSTLNESEQRNGFIGVVLKNLSSKQAS